MSQTPSSDQETQPSPPTPQFNKPHPYIGPRTPQETAIVICALGLIAAFFAPWIRLDESYSGAAFLKRDPAAGFLWSIPILAIGTVLKLRDAAARRRLGTATAFITWFSVGYCLTKAQPFGVPAWGERLTQWFSLGLFAFAGDLRIAAPIDYIAKKLGSRKANVYSHSWTPTPDCHFSTKEFYDQLEKAIRAKQWPGVQLFRIDHFEAGLLSHKREYLRVIRQRQLFDICAATFGRDYFFSVREAEIPAVVTVRAFFAILVTLSLVFSMCVHSLGIFFGSFATFALVVFAVWFFFNILKLGLSKVDSMLIQLPVIGSVYEAYFRRDTYFQQDTRIFFIHAVNELVKEHVEETTSAKGLKHLNLFENQPILDGLYKRSRVALRQSEATPILT